VRASFLAGQVAVVAGLPVVVRLFGIFSRAVRF